MCLAVPGRIESVDEARDEAALGRTGVVDFQGNRVEVNLAMTPEAAVGDWILVHAGFAISQLDEAAARETWEYLREIDEAARGEAGGRDPGPSPFDRNLT